MEASTGGTFTWQELKDNFIKDFSFFPVEESIKEVIEEIKKFIEPKNNVNMTNDHILLESTCNNISTKVIQVSS